MSDIDDGSPLRRLRIAEATIARLVADMAEMRERMDALAHDAAYARENPTPAVLRRVGAL